MVIKMQRIVLKLSGEALAGEKKTGFDEATVTAVAKTGKRDCRQWNPGRYRNWWR